MGELVSFCILCNRRVWPWQAQVPTQDHLSCVLQDVWLDRTKPGHTHPEDWVTGGWMKQRVNPPSRTDTKGPIDTIDTACEPGN